MGRIDIQDQTKLVLIGDDGQQMLLLNSRDYLHNKSRIPLHRLLQGKNGELHTDYVLQDYLIRRNAINMENGVHPLSAMNRLVMECLLADKLMTFSVPVNVICISLADMSVSVREIAETYNEMNRVVEIGYDSTDLFRSGAFMIVVVALTEDFSSEQAGKVGDLLHKDGMGLLIVDNSSPLILENVERMIGDVEDYVTADNYHCIRFKKENIRWDVIKKKTVSEEKKVIADRIVDVLSEKTDCDKNIDNVQDCLRVIVAEIDDLVKMAQREWALDEKQFLLDLKEAVCDYIINFNDPKYCKVYLNRLEQLLDEKDSSHIEGNEL